MSIEDEKIEALMWEIINRFLIPKHLELGMKASGEWIDSLQGVGQDNVGKIRGKHYTRQLVWGRKPGKRPPISAIQEWVGHKFGIYGQESLSVAFAIANKIKEEGTIYYQKGGTDLLEVLEDPEVMEFMRDSIKEILIAEVRLRIKRMSR